MRLANQLQRQSTVSVLPFCWAAMLGSFVTVCSAEDLTTLDGNTYQNITFITNYANQVVFRYNDERTYVANSNLPAEFRVLHGIVVGSNKSTNSAQPAATPLNSSDLFLAQHRDSDLSQVDTDVLFTNNSSGMRVSEAWHVYLCRGKVDLGATTEVMNSNPNVHGKENSEVMHFEIGQQLLVSNILNKFIEWDTVATTNKAENFEKELARRPVSKSDWAPFPDGNICNYTFSWRTGQSALRVHDPNDSYSGFFSKDDVAHFQALLTRLPDLEEKLVAAIRNKDVQKNLFK